MAKRDTRTDFNALLRRRQMTLEQYCTERGIETDEQLTAHAVKEGFKVEEMPHLIKKTIVVTIRGEALLQELQRQPRKQKKSRETEHSFDADEALSKSKLGEALREAQSVSREHTVEDE